MERQAAHQPLRVVVGGVEALDAQLLQRDSSICRLGFARPVSRKLRCRADTSAASASASWLSPRAFRHRLRSEPTRSQTREA